MVIKFLGIVFHCNEESGWALDQENTIEELPENFGLAESAPVRVPISGDDGDEERSLLPSHGSDSQTEDAYIPVAGGQFTMDSSMHKTRHSICGDTE